jgi:hypothetical protein
MITSIEYNRRTQRWELRGEIGELLADFPAGPNGRHAALLAQLETEIPDVATLALEIENRIPRISGRAIRGAELMMKDKIITCNRPNRWRVGSLTNPHWVYTVHELDPRHTGLRWHCNCPDWVRGESGSSSGAPQVKHGEVYSPTCKHIIAVMLLEETTRTWPPACPACLGAMNVRRQQEDGSGLPFWSCRNFPHCRGRRDFTTHPDDRQTGRNSEHARSLSMERATRDGLLQVSSGARRRAQRRRLENVRLERR